MMRKNNNKSLVKNYPQFTEPRFGASSSTTIDSYLLITCSLARWSGHPVACALARTLGSVYKIYKGQRLSPNNENFLRERSTSTLPHLEVRKGQSLTTKRRETTIMANHASSCNLFVVRCIIDWNIISSKIEGGYVPRRAHPRNFKLSLTTPELTIVQQRSMN
uniref:Uncharacterized protein n=1 Tax=Timema bartmani TaxID=61472 RepID=A0A7R9EV88_9NEOP|nr:unnamed protein product [Timema bartmani]